MPRSRYFAIIHLFITQLVVEAGRNTEACGKFNFKSCMKTVNRGIRRVLNGINLAQTAVLLNAVLSVHLKFSANQGIIKIGVVS